MHLPWPYSSWFFYFKFIFILLTVENLADRTIKRGIHRSDNHQGRILCQTSIQFNPTTRQQLLRNCCGCWRSNLSLIDSNSSILTLVSCYFWHKKTNRESKICPQKQFYSSKCVPVISLDFLPWVSNQASNITVP